MFKYIEMFHSIQGESQSVGMNVVFLRLAKCNLKCNFCDSTYSWNEGANISVDKIVEYIRLKAANGIVITGGEPLLQKEEITKLIGELPVDFHIEIETNGTIMPAVFDDFIYYNVSPKLSNSGEPYEKRINLNVLETYGGYWDNSILKFVVDKEEDIEEIKSLLDDLEYEVNKSQIYLMPEGITAESQQLKNKQVIKWALENGWNYSPRIGLYMER